jgi:hypothetical protein
MWVISMIVLIVVSFVLSGQDFPPQVSEWLKTVFPHDAAATSQIVAVSFIVGLCIGGSPLHLFLRYLDTVVHELGHTFAMGVLGLRPIDINISPDTSGFASFNKNFEPNKLQSCMTLFAGYPAPAVASVCAVLAARNGFPQAWFAFSTLTLAVALLLLMSNIWGKVWTSITVIGSYFGLKMLSVDVISIITSGIGGYLAIEAVRGVRIQSRWINSGNGETTDGQRLALQIGLKTRTGGRLHFLIVMSISLFSAYLAINTYRSEIKDWATTIIHQRLNG